MLEADAQLVRRRAPPARRSRRWGPGDDDLVIDRFDEWTAEAHPTWSFGRDAPAIQQAEDVPPASAVQALAVVDFIRTVHAGGAVEDRRWQVIPPLFGEPTSIHEDVRIDGAWLRTGKYDEQAPQTWRLLLQAELRHRDNGGEMDASWRARSYDIRPYWPIVASEMLS